jgi:hypothetical protein
VGASNGRWPAPGYLVAADHRLAATHYQSHRRCMIAERYRCQREYPQPPPPGKNNTKRTTNRVPISDLLYNVRLTRPRDVFPVLLHRPAACRRAIACLLPLTARLNPPPTQSERHHPYTVRSIRRQFGIAHKLGHNCSSSPGEKTTVWDEWGYTVGSASLMGCASP